MARSRPLLLLALIAIIAIVLAAASDSAARPNDSFSLRPGQSAFWSGGPGDGGASSWTYRLEVARGGDRLRVAVDDRDLDLGTGFTIELLDPTGKVDTRGNYELFVYDPKPGSWLVNVIPDSADATKFRMRAKLEQEDESRADGRLLRPNLRPEPGYDFSFSWAGGTCEVYTGTSECGSEAPAPIPPSCAADETAEDHAVRCLRFSMGYQNAGDGPVNLQFGDLDLASGTADVTQLIYRSNLSESYEDNDHVERTAGTATYHKTHGHYHYDNIFGARLFSVDPKTHRVESLGDVAKRGACAHDYVFVDFERFYQDRKNLADSGNDCSFLFTEPNVRARIGLSTGWADIYTAELSDNYVDFGLHLDGHYLLRFYTDIDSTIEETNERDNVAYSYIRVSGLEIELLERGRGRDPWDPKKVVLRGLGD